MSFRSVGPVLLIVAVCGGVRAVQAAPADVPQADYSMLVNERAPAIVSIKYILKDEGEQQEEDTTGCMIEAGGLVLTAVPGGLGARFGGAAPTPTEIKVLVGDDNQGVSAKIIGRDTELGLAWLQIDTPPAQPYKFIDFSAGATAKHGDNVYIVSQMGKFFDRAPAIAEARVGAIVEKPRKLYIPSIGLAGGETMGLPVFDAQGKPVGVNTLILPDREEMESGDMRAAMRGITGGMILPASEVVEATARAKEVAKSNPTEEPADVAEKPAEPAEKPEEKPGEPAPAPR
jgi:S1-C subfamily serine protease